MQRIRMPPKKRVRSGESEQGIEEESDRARSPTPSSDGGAEDRKGGEKARRKKINYSEEEEIELADWLKTHPHIYTKGLRDYKDTDKKTRLWDYIYSQKWTRFVYGQLRIAA